MLQEIEELFTEELLVEAAVRYGVSVKDFRFIGGFESFVYEYVKDSKSYILKITNEIRRGVEQIMGELEWIKFLADHGVPVCTPIPSNKGNWIEVIEPIKFYPHIKVPSRFLLISYHKAKGHEATSDDWNEALFETLSRVMGMMHHLTKKYQVSDLRFRRQEWYEEEQLQARKYVSESSHRAGFFHAFGIF